MVKILVIAALILAVVILYNYFIRSTSDGKRRIIKNGLFVILAAVLIALVVTGRLNWLVAVAGSLVPLLPKVFSSLIKYFPSLFMLFKKYKSVKEKKSSKKMHGQQSRVETLYLIMMLDHDTGEMDGEVIKGVFQGRILSDMASSEVRQMMHECEDDETVSLLMAYMNRYHGRRESSNKNESYSDKGNEEPGFMSIHEAREILGLDESAKKNEIIEAHRHLIQKLHTDRGGSEYLAMKINRAKDILLTAL